MVRLFFTDTHSLCPSTLTVPIPSSPSSLSLFCTLPLYLLPSRFLLFFFVQVKHRLLCVCVVLMQLLLWINFIKISIKSKNFPKERLPRIWYGVLPIDFWSLVLCPGLPRLFGPPHLSTSESLGPS